MKMSKEIEGGYSTREEAKHNAAIPDGEVDKIRKWLNAAIDSDWETGGERIRKGFGGDVERLLARLTALEAENVSEREARHKLEAALRSKDLAMQTLFDRLRSHGDNCEDLIP
jgi:hypothetical protein